MTDAADQLAQETAEYIAQHLSRPAGTAPLDYRVSYRTAERPPSDVQAIKDTLLSGDVWVSWLDAKVADAMRAIWGPAITEDQHGR